MRIKRSLCLLLSVVICLSFCFVGCSKSVETQATTAIVEEVSTTQETTTIEHTTEDLETTFAEISTRKVYDGLCQDSQGSYPYELASYTTTYNAGDKRRTANLLEAVNSIDYIVIPDGQVFSFNQVVGKRTIAAGYQTAKVIANNEFVDGLGGGVCQVSSTVFEAVLRANVEIVERSNHSLEISYVPLGGDATVQWNTQDFQFRNSLGCNLQLLMYCSGGKLTCKVFADQDVSVGNVKIDISRSGNTYILTRTVNGERNYSTKSTYKKA